MKDEVKVYHTYSSELNNNTELVLKPDFDRIVAEKDAQIAELKAELKELSDIQEVNSENETKLWEACTNQKNKIAVLEARFEKCKEQRDSCMRQSYPDNFSLAKEIEDNELYSITIDSIKRGE